MSASSRRERERSERRRLIIETARELAVEQGWEAVTTRRLAERIEYSQPVLYSHFAGKEAIVAAVALEGFDELTAAMAQARTVTSAPDRAWAAVATAYVEFGLSKPAVYDAMFAQRSELRFADADTPATLHSAFEQLSTALAPIAAGRDLETLTEIGWAALHGLVTLTRSGRLRPDQHAERLVLLTEGLLATAR
jgi:AcrR family transcriptional regulator